MGNIKKSGEIINEKGEHLGFWIEFNDDVSPEMINSLKSMSNVKTEDAEFEIIDNNQSGDGSGESLPNCDVQRKLLDKYDQTK